jgi:transposase-like protein
MKLAYDEGDGTVDDIARRYGVTKQTIYNTIKRLRAEAGS